MKKILFSLLALIISASIYAYDIEVPNADGVIIYYTIYYDYNGNETELEVTSGSRKYQGTVIIPAEVFHTFAPPKGHKQIENE